MPLITSVRIHAAKSLLGVRNKISFIACELGIPDIRASRLATACSEVARDLLRRNISPTISISLSDKEHKQLKITFSPWNESMDQKTICQLYAPLVDSIQQGEASLIYYQQLDSRIRTDKESCAQLREKMRSMVVPTRAELEMQATHDALTHLLNRYALEQGFSEELARARRYKFPLSVLIMDIDLFKRVNDTYGHHAGDACLVALGAMMLSVSRKQDIAARFGGEEFVLVLPHTRPDEALLLADRFRKLIESSPVHYENKAINITISIGISGFEQAPDINSKQLLELADQALYEAKETGRNRVCTKLPSAVITENAPK